jgi:hypothetical protein
MGTIKQGILGGVSGKIGNVVGGSWKGINYLRVLPASVKNANTQQQVSQRSKFSTVIKFLQPITKFIRVGYKGLAVRQSAFNAAMSYNYHNALTGEYPAISIDYANAAVSLGNLPGAINPVCSSDEAAKVSISWEANTGQGEANDSDIAMAVVYNPELGDAVYSLNGGIRSEGSMTLELPASYSGKEVQCYISFMVLDSVPGDQSQNEISNSAYAGSVVVM